MATGASEWQSWDLMRLQCKQRRGISIGLGVVLIWEDFLEKEILGLMRNRTAVSYGVELYS